MPSMKLYGLQSLRWVAFSSASVVYHLLWYYWCHISKKESYISQSCEACCSRLYFGYHNRVVHFDGVDQIDDTLTKALPKPVFEKNLSKLGVVTHNLN